MWHWCSYNVVIFHYCLQSCKRKLWAGQCNNYCFTPLTRHNGRGWVPKIVGRYGGKYRTSRRFRGFRVSELARRAHDAAVLEEVHQHVATQRIRRCVEGPSPVDPSDLLDKRVVRAL